MEREGDSARAVLYYCTMEAGGRILMEHGEDEANAGTGTCIVGWLHSVKYTFSRRKNFSVGGEPHS